MDLMTIGEKIALFFIPFLFALCFHEWAHAFVAKRKGDQTAEMMGRLTLNPMAHIDLFGTVIFPLMVILGGLPIFFGWAKPVPVDSRNLSDPKRDMFWIAFAGPLSNLFLAFIGAFFFALNARFNPDISNAGSFNQLLNFFISINLFLAVFNLLPIHPLDGGKILARFLPESWNVWLMDHHQFIGLGVFGLILLDGLSGSGVSFLAYPVIILANIFIGLWGYAFCHFDIVIREPKKTQCV